MNTKLLVAIMASILLIGIFVTAVSIKPAKAYTDAIYIDPASINKDPINVNSFFDVYVDVTIDPARGSSLGLLGFDINITWDNSMITFDSLDNTSLSTIWPQGFFTPLTPAVQSGAGYVRYAAVAQGTPAYTGTGHLFKLTFKIVKSCNFVLSTLIHFDMVKLSDPYGDDIAAIKTDCTYTMSKTTPDLEFEYAGPAPPLEYCKTFQIKVYVTDCTNLNDYNLVIAYDYSLLELTVVDWAGGVLANEPDTGSYTEVPDGTITVIDTGGNTYTGLKGLLFTLSFHVRFDDAPEHIWRTNNLGPLHAFIKFNDATLSFVDPVGTITKSGITMPADLDIVVNLIQGDVNCDGKVNVMDLTTVAALYDQTVTPDIAKYNLKATDNVIDLYDLVKVAANFWYGV